jgi:hypothetical protein
MLNHRCTGFFGNPGRLICRAVIYDDNLGVGIARLRCADDIADRRGLILGRNDD